MPLHVSSTCAYRQEVKIVLYSLWYHHTETSEWSKITKIQFYKYEHIVVKFMCEFYYYVLILKELYFSNFSYLIILDHSFFQCDDTRGCIVQF